MFATIAGQTNRYTWCEARGHTKPALQEVNNRPCCAQQRVNYWINTVCHCQWSYMIYSCRMYPAMETLIEPHRLISCMFCLVASSRPMLSSPKYFPDGPNHVLPLLQLALPGIDPNDFKKTLVSDSCLQGRGRERGGGRGAGIYAECMQEQWWVMCCFVMILLNVL